jgi:hypothetical protein
VTKYSTAKLPDVLPCRKTIKNIWNRKSEQILVENQSSGRRLSVTSPLEKTSLANKKEPVIYPAKNIIVK